MTRCKPGDMAIITRIERPGFRWCLGRVVQVDCLLPYDEEPTWALKEPLAGPGGLYTAVPDRCLTPIPPLPEDEGVRTGKPEEITT